MVRSATTQVHSTKEEPLEVQVKDWDTAVNGQYISVQIEGVTFFMSHQQLEQLKADLENVQVIR